MTHQRVELHVKIIEAVKNSYSSLLTFKQRKTSFLYIMEIPQTKNHASLLQITLGKYGALYYLLEGSCNCLIFNCKA